MKKAGDVSQAIVAERLGKTQSAVSWCITGRSELSPLERIELKRWIAELDAEARIGEGMALPVCGEDWSSQPLAFFEHLKGCPVCLERAYRMAKSRR